MDVHRLNFKLVIGFLAGALALAPAAQAAPIHILAFGTSLTAGYGLPPGTEFPAVLQRRLKAAGVDAVVINAGVSGDTTADGVSRLDWSLAGHPDAVILELGSNDALRALDPALVEKNLTTIVARIEARHIPALLLGMKAPRNLGPRYVQAFDAIYPRLARQFGVLFYPFVLAGVALDPKLNQADGLHPNPAGVKVIVGRMLPYVLRLVDEVKAKDGGKTGAAGRR